MEIQNSNKIRSLILKRLTYMAIFSKEVKCWYYFDFFMVDKIRECITVDLQRQLFFAFRKIDYLLLKKPYPQTLVRVLQSRGLSEFMGQYVKA